MTQRQIFNILGSDIGIWHTAKELASAIGISDIAVREQLRALTKKGCVEVKEGMAAWGIPHKYRRLS